MEYYSDEVPKAILAKEILNKTCNYAGKLTLILKQNRKLSQEGPFIIPPIRWVDSFGISDEFIIECQVVDIEPEPKTVDDKHNEFYVSPIRPDFKFPSVNSHINIPDSPTTTNLNTTRVKSEINIEDLTESEDQTQSNNNHLRNISLESTSTADSIDRSNSNTPEIPDPDIYTLVFDKSVLNNSHYKYEIIAQYS